MIEWILAKLGGLVGADVALILMVIYTSNLALSGMMKALEYIKDKTESNVDNKLYKWFGSASKVLLKILDMVGYNPEHKKKS